MTKQIPWGRGIAGLLAVAALAAAVWFAAQWWQMRTQCADAQTTVLAILPDAFGTNGIAQADFNPKYDFTCKEMLVVEHSLPNHSLDDVTETLKGLRADLVIADATGKAVLEEALTDDWFRLFRTGPDTNAVLPAFVFAPVPAGHYRLLITVHHPAGVLANVPHRVVARYELCGLERLATAFTGGIAIVAILASASLATGIAVVTKRERRHSNHAPDGIRQPADGSPKSPA